MTVDDLLPGAVEPKEWRVAFFPTSSSRLISAVAFGKFKHVSAYAYAPGIKCWLYIDANWTGMNVFLIPHELALKQIPALIEGAEIVKISKRAGPMPMKSRIGFYCVTAVKHVIGLPCVAITCDQLYRYAIANGGVCENRGA